MNICDGGRGQDKKVNKNKDVKLIGLMRIGWLIACLVF